MNALKTGFSMSIAYLREKPLATFLNVLLLSLGVATIIALMLVMRQVEERLERDTAGIDLVIGAKGSPLQLILSSVFHIDVPTGNIPMQAAAPLIESRMVKRAVPLALGDSYRGFRIVGTTPEYAALYQATMVAGAFWTKPLQAVIGAEVARATSLDLGKRFAGSHGLSDSSGTHGDHPFEVIGVLAATGTVLDRLILTSVESIWRVHDQAESNVEAAHKVEAKHPGEGTPTHAHQHAAVAPANEKPATERPPTETPTAESNRAAHHDDDAHQEITAYLIQYATPLAAVSFPRLVNATSAMQAASPAMESARLFSLLGIGIGAMKLFAAVMIVCAALGIFVGLMSALQERCTDLALLRVLGATPATIHLTILGQGLLLGIGGVILGIALGHAGAHWIGVTMSTTHRVEMTGLMFMREEWLVAAGAIFLSVVASVFPAWRAYRESVSESLSSR